VAKLNDRDRERIIELLGKGEDLPLDYKHVLFPPEKKEYELVYAGKEREEDILADTMAVPLQPIKIFGKNGGNWSNKLIFGDNLQVMKSLLNDPEVKGQVKLIYIDPPFGTGDEYGSINGEKAYTAKLKGSHFMEFFRKRIIFLRDVLSDDGCIFIRLDYHFSHYFKIILDEFLLFRNEIIINRVHKRLRNLKRFNVSTEILLLYSKNENFLFNNPEAPRRCNYCGAQKESIWDDLTSPGLRNPPERNILGKKFLPRRGRHFSYTQEKIIEMEKNGRIRLNKDVSYYDLDGNKINERPEYRQRIYQAFGVIHRSAAKAVRYRMSPKALFEKSTNERNRSSVGYASIKRGESSIFYDDLTLKLSDEDSMNFLKELESDDSRPVSALEKIDNTFNFKTPLNLAISDHKPERLFIKRLIAAENAKTVDAWLKSTDQDFYPIEYSWKKGEHPKRGRFNPDFFIKIEGTILVVEIKGDEEIRDPSDENKAKFKAAKKHFRTLNDQQKRLKYHFNFLTPEDYDYFFDHLRNGNFNFSSKLDAELEKNGS